MRRPERQRRETSPEAISASDLGAAALPVLPRIASALDYPTRPVHIIVGFPAGGASDIPARVIGQWLSERLGPPFVVENPSGAAGRIPPDTAAPPPPDASPPLLTPPPPP